MGVTAPAVADPSVLGDLRRARRRRRFERLDVVEILYRAYLILIAAGIVVIVAAGLTGDAAVPKSQLSEVAARGPALVGAVGALAMALVLRSAGRGGPLSLERADVRIVLMAPVSRKAALAGPARQLLRRWVLAGAGAGAVAGVLAYHRLPGSPPGWVVAGAVVGAVAALAAAGAGLSGAGARIGRRRAGLLGLVVIGWSAADVVASTKTSPLSLLGGVALWPLAVHPLDLIGAVVGIGLGACGLLLVGGLSIEAAEERSSLVGALRVAATFRDLRAVALLRRQLAHEGSRSRPWLRLPKGGSRAAWAVQKRDLQAILRWPVARFVRIVLLGAVAGLCMRGVWAGTAPLAVIAALALWVAAMDAAEGLAQEMDHPDRASSLPRGSGWVNLRHLLVPSVLSVAVACVGVAVAIPFGNPGLVVEVGLATAIPAGLAAVSGAAVSILRTPGSSVSELGLSLSPEMAGVTLVIRELLPPALAFCGLLPVLLAHNAASHGQQPFDSSVNAAFLVLLVPVAVFGWVHARGRFSLTGEMEARTRAAQEQVQGDTRPSAPVRERQGRGASKPAASSPPSAGGRADGRRVQNQRKAPSAGAERPSGGRSKGGGTPPSGGQGRTKSRRGNG